MILIDGDIIAYRCAFSAKDGTTKDAIESCDDLLDYVISECSFHTGNRVHKLFLTGKSNFRTEIAKTAEYKGNRKSVEKPVHLTAIRDHMINSRNAIVSDGEEADDLIAKGATEYGSMCVVASVDKDMLQLEGAHFNFNKGEWKFVDAFEGLTFFYTQILTGDAADNIKGLYNIGPKKAEKILKGAKTEEDLWEKVLAAYNGDVDRVVENARLLWLRRYDGEIWEPLEQRKQKEELANKRLGIGY